MSISIINVFIYSSGTMQSGFQMHVQMPKVWLLATRFAPSKQHSPSLSTATHAFALHLTLSPINATTLLRPSFKISS